jgi:hypothetical protein
METLGRRVTARMTRISAHLLLEDVMNAVAREAMST